MAMLLLTWFSCVLVVGVGAQWGGGGGWGDRPDFRRFNNIPPPRGPPPPFGFGLVPDLPNPFQRRWSFDHFDNLRSQPMDWGRRARRFCRRFWGHPLCRGGRNPQFGDIQNMVEAIHRRGGEFLPKIPKINIRNPLIGVDKELVRYVEEFKPNFGWIEQEAVSHIKNVCRSRKCMEQDTKFEELRKTVSTKIFDFEKRVTGKDTSDAITLRLDRTQQIKQALLEKANLTDVVVAADDGIFDGDVLLTEKQQTFLLNELGKAGVGTDLPPPTNDAGSDDETRNRRAAIFFEENVVQKWDITKPIPYVMDDSLEELDRNDVGRALQEISSKTCLKFQSLKTAPKGYHINYLKVDSPTFCGLSYIGRTEPANPVYLSFQCGNSVGVTIHETMHALGVNHQHLRMDRDQHITVDWSNINPQHYDYFVVADSKIYTTYGIKYDYGSIMHYNAFTGAVNPSKPTMIPKVNKEVNMPKLGQRTAMSASDIELLNKMYCKPASCEDKNVYCGAWALKDTCTNPNHNVYMANNCKKSCNLCK